MAPMITYSIPYPTLTIAIPTYNRREAVTSLVGQLLPQLTSSCKLVVYDNQSEVPVQTYLPEGVHVVRNPINVGMVGNFLRCFEGCDTEWLWIIGDDDTVTPNGVALVLERLRRHPDAVFINFKSVQPWIQQRPDEIICEGISSFVRDMDSFANTLWISTGVYNSAALIKNLRFGYMFGYTFAPNLVLAMMGMIQGGKGIFCADEVAVYTPPPPDQKWNYFDGSTGIATFLDLPFSAADRRILSRKIFKASPTPALELGNLLSNVDAANLADARYRFLARWSRFLFSSGSIKLFIFAFIIYLGSVFRAPARFLLRTIYRWVKKRDLFVEKSGRFNRF